jgi:NADH-quinone oxidoreductase subunit J
VWTSVIILGGAIGVVVARNPVHSALMLVMTLFGVAVIFVELEANFLAAVQVIVYAGAIVVLFLFVIMLLGVDKRENLEKDPLRGQRPLAAVLVLLALAGVLGLGFEAHWSVGAHSVAGVRGPSGGDVAALGKSVFTTYLFPFEVTSALLVIAVVGAVVLSRAPRGGKDSDDDDEVDESADDDGDAVVPDETVELVADASEAEGPLEDNEIEVQDAEVMEKETAS